MYPTRSGGWQRAVLLRPLFRLVPSPKTKGTSFCLTECIKTVCHKHRPQAATIRPCKRKPEPFVRVFPVHGHMLQLDGSNGNSTDCQMVPAYASKLKSPSCELVLMPNPFAASKKPWFSASILPQMPTNHGFSCILCEIPTRFLHKCQPTMVSVSFGATGFRF